MDMITLAMLNSLKKSGGVGHTELTKVYALPKTTVTAENYTTDFGVNGCFFLPVFTLEDGKKYKVVVDDQTLDYIGKPYDAQLIGNSALSGETIDDTGEPWLVVSYPNMGVYAVTFADPAENEKPHTIAIYEETETIHPIDPKFLPGVKIDLAEYGIDLASIVMSGGGTVDVDDAKTLWDAVDSGKPITFVVNFGNFNIFVTNPGVITDATTGHALQTGWAAPTVYGTTQMVMAISINRYSSIGAKFYVKLL